MSEPVTALRGAVAEQGLVVRIADRGPLGMVTLRGDLSDQGFREAAAGAAGCAFPARRRMALAGERGLGWMSPDELLLLCPYAEAPEAERRLRAALAGTHHLAVNVSDARAAIRLTGDGARDVLAKGAPVDLSPAVFGPDDFRRSRIAQVAAAFWQAGEGPDMFDLVCFRSVGAYLFDWLKASARRGAAPGLY